MCVCVRSWLSLSSKRIQAIERLVEQPVGAASCVRRIARPRLRLCEAAAWRSSAMRRQVRKCKILSCPVLEITSNIHVPCRGRSWRNPGVTASELSVSRCWDLGSDRQQIWWSSPVGWLLRCFWMSYSCMHVMQCNIKRLLHLRHINKYITLHL